MTGSENRTDLRRTLLRCTVAMLVYSFTVAPASAQDNKPSLKEILGRAQSDSERKAVEDLIGKLQGKAPQPKQPADDVAKPVPVTEPKLKTPATTSTHGAPEQPADKQSPTTESDQSAAVTKAPAEQAAAVAKEEQQPTTPQTAAEPASEAANLAVEKAERSQLPSVDLEVLFEYKSDELTPAAVDTLTTLGRALTDERLATSTFLIGGHTDAKGSAAYNLHLSQRRAEAVRQFLIATFAIDANRLTAKGFGERYLKNPQRRRSEENRRVQVVNVSPQEAR